jgi:hypothetical protein
MAGLVREASSVNNVLQINSRAIEDEAARIVAEQRKVSPELSGTTKALDADDPWGDGLQVSVGINLLAHAAANPQPLPLVAVGNEVNEAAVVTTENYFLFRMGVTVVPRTVTRVRIHSLVEFIQFWYLGPGKWVHAFENCKSLMLRHHQRQVRLWYQSTVQWRVDQKNYYGGLWMFITVLYMTCHHLLLKRMMAALLQLMM